MKRGFTMIELIFVIVIIGILASIAVPKLFATRDDAIVAKIKTDVAAIKSGIELEHQRAMMLGHTDYIPDLDKYRALSDKDKDKDRGCGGLFCAVLKTSLPSNEKQGWEKKGENAYYVRTNPTNKATVTYNKNDGTLSCVGDICSKIGF